MPVLKSLMTSACERNCFYCPFRAGRSEMKRLPSRRMIWRAVYVVVRARRGRRTVSLVGHHSRWYHQPGLDSRHREILREKYGFRGYMHLKIMPGAEYDQVRRAMELANRVSVNLEAPNQDRLDQIAPGKKFDDELLKRLEWVQNLRSGGDLRASSTTEFVIGPAGEPDVEILNATEYLYRRLGLARTYFSRFRPITNTPLDNHPETDPTRNCGCIRRAFCCAITILGLKICRSRPRVICRCTLIPNRHGPTKI